ncbi:MAG: PadR family transcriptional regulator [Candidatus Bathyarchaeota archaeon]|nr:PadR family transcriptional regulator [Candidatus Bathyarchaeota archaeon]
MSTHNGRTVGLPRGLLRFLVLNMLREKPLSGTEIVEIIENQTEGNWKPSPGSIYPLLAWLSDKGITKELPRDQDGLKRYCFTELGNKFLEKQLIQAEDFQKKMEFLVPLLVRGLPIGVNQEKFKDTKDAAVQLMKLFMKLRSSIDQLSKEDSIEITKAIKACSKRIEKIFVKMEK